MTPFIRRSYDKLQKIIDSTPRHDLLLLIGDLNAKVGKNLKGKNGIVGLHRVQCERNDNGERYVDFCAINNFAITSTMFPHKNIHLQTWISQNGEHRYQIGHMAINGKFKRSVQDVMVSRRADVGSDHYLLVTKIRLRLHKAERSPTTSRRYEPSKLKVPQIKEKFSIELKNRFSILNNYEESEIGDIWNNFRAAYNDTATNTLGPRKKKNQEWISNNSMKLVDERRTI